MEENGTPWLRVRGVGRERLGRFLAEFLEESGYTVSEVEDPSGSTPSLRISAELTRPPPAIPGSMRSLAIRFSPTAGGSQAIWELPRGLANPADRGRAERFVTEMLARLDQRVATETRGTSRLVRERPGSFPFDPPRLEASGTEAARLSVAPPRAGTSPP
jgi:hypothetical protein